MGRAESGAATFLLYIIDFRYDFHKPSAQTGRVRRGVRTKLSTSEQQHGRVYMCVDNDIMTCLRGFLRALSFPNVTLFIYVFFFIDENKLRTIIK